MIPSLAEAQVAFLVTAARNLRLRVRIPAARLELVARPLRSRKLNGAVEIRPAYLYLRLYFCYTPSCFSIIINYRCVVDPIRCSLEGAGRAASLNCLKECPIHLPA
jgi:hypothetical protein